jgi:hypothetical protein
MSITESDIEGAIQDYTYLSVQTSAQETALTNTTANLLHSSRSRRQGNFTSFSALAALQIAKDEANYAVTLPDAYKLMAYAYYIQYLYERKFKDFNATSISSGSDSVTRPGSGALAAYYDVFESFKTMDTTIERHTDYTNYPDAWRNTQMEIEDIPIDT